MIDTTSTSISRLPYLPQWYSNSPPSTPTTIPYVSYQPAYRSRSLCPTSTEPKKASIRGWQLKRSSFLLPDLGLKHINMKTLTQSSSIKYLVSGWLSSDSGGTPLNTKSTFLPLNKSFRAAEKLEKATAMSVPTVSAVAFGSGLIVTNASQGYESSSPVRFMLLWFVVVMEERGDCNLC